MYCPQCATPNGEGVKFCRSCGTELEAVALVLKGATPATTTAGGGENEIGPRSAREWLERQASGVSGMTKGTVLLLVSFLIGVALALFSPADVPWMILWMIFFGWLAVWGGIELATGVGNVIEAKSRLRLLGPDAASTPRQISSRGEPVTTANSAGALSSSTPPSVTEGTTRELGEVLKRKS